MGSKSRRRHDRDASRSVNPLEDLDEFKALLDVAFRPSEAMAWITRPHDALDGARPIDVFFKDGLDAVKPAILQSSLSDSLTHR